MLLEPGAQGPFGVRMLMDLVSLVSSDLHVQEQIRDLTCYVAKMLQGNYAMLLVSVWRQSMLLVSAAADTVA